MTAAVPLDWQLTDTYFVVAHLHYVLLGINVFPVIGGLYYWFPKITGRMTSERLGKLGFWVSFIGFNLAFFPMHLTGLRGHAAAHLHLSGRHGLGPVQPLIISVGAVILAIGDRWSPSYNFAISLRRGAPAGPNPWDAATLEWSVASPPPAYNFRRIPIVASRHPCGKTGCEHVRGALGPRQRHRARPRPRNHRHHRARRRGRQHPAHAGRQSAAAAACRWR